MPIELLINELIARYGVAAGVVGAVILYLVVANVSIQRSLSAKREADTRRDNLITDLAAQAMAAEARANEADVRARGAETRANEAYTRLIKAEADVAALTKQVADGVARETAQTARMDGLAAENRTLRTQITALETTAREQAATITELTERLAMATCEAEKVPGLEARASALEARASEMEALVASKDAEIEVLTSERDTLAADKTALEARVTALETEVGALKAQLASLAPATPEVVGERPAPVESPDAEA